MADFRKSVSEKCKEYLAHGIINKIKDGFYELEEELHKIDSDKNQSGEPIQERVEDIASYILKLREGGCSRIADYWDMRLGNYIKNLPE